MAISFHNSSHIVLLLTSFLLLLLLPSALTIALNDQQTQQLIDKICRQMEEYGFCNSVFHQNLPSPPTDIAGLTKITIDQSLNNATNTHSFVLNLLQNVSDPAEKNALIACENAYKIVADSFQTAVVNFAEKNYEAVADAERDTPRAHESCITSFGVPPNPPNPLVERNREMRILIAMSLVSARLLINGN